MADLSKRELESRIEEISANVDGNVTAVEVELSDESTASLMDVFDRGDGVPHYRNLTGEEKDVVGESPLWRGSFTGGAEKTIEVHPAGLTPQQKGVLDRVCDPEGSPSSDDGDRDELSNYPMACPLSGSSATRLHEELSRLVDGEVSDWYWYISFSLDADVPRVALAPERRIMELTDREDEMLDGFFGSQN